MGNSLPKVLANPDFNFKLSTWKAEESLEVIDQGNYSLSEIEVIKAVAESAWRRDTGNQKHGGLVPAMSKMGAFLRKQQSGKGNALKGALIKYQTLNKQDLTEYTWQLSSIIIPLCYRWDA